MRGSFKPILSPSGIFANLDKRSQIYRCIWEFARLRAFVLTTDRWIQMQIGKLELFLDIWDSPGNYHQTEFDSRQNGWSIWLHAPAQAMMVMIIGIEWLRWVWRLWWLYIRLSDHETGTLMTVMQWKRFLCVPPQKVRSMLRRENSSKVESGASSFCHALLFLTSPCCDPSTFISQGPTS